MADVEPPPNPDGMHLDDDDPSLTAFDAAVKTSATGTGRNGAAFRELHTFKTSLYFSVDNPVAGSSKVRKAFEGWLSQVNASSELQGTQILVTAMNGMAIDDKTVKIDGKEFEKFIGWERTHNTRFYRNVFLCVNISTHVKFSNLKHSIIKYLLDENIQMDRNHSEGEDKATEMASIGYLGLADPDSDIRTIQTDINGSVSKIAREKYNQDQLRQLGFSDSSHIRGDVALSHGAVKGISKTYGKVTNPRAVIISCPKSQLEFYLRHLQEAISDMAWSPDMKKLRFVPFAMKSVKAQHDAFTNMLMFSAKELDKKTSVQILGIGRGDMRHPIRKQLLEACPHITHIETTDRTDSQGRWKLICEKTKVDEVEKWIADNLEKMCNSMEMRTELPGFDEPRLVSSPRVPTAQIKELLDTSQAVLCLDDPDNYPSLNIKQTAQKKKKQGAWKMSPTIAKPHVRFQLPQVPRRNTIAAAPTQGTNRPSTTRRTSQPTAECRTSQPINIGIDEETQQTLKKISETLQSQKDRIEENRDQALAQQRKISDDVAKMRSTVAEQSTAVQSFCQVIQQVSDNHAELKLNMQARDKETMEMKADIKKLTENMDAMLQALRDITADPVKVKKMQKMKLPSRTTSPPPRASRLLDSDSDDDSLMETSSEREDALTTRLPESPGSPTSPSPRRRLKTPKKTLKRSSRRNAKHKSARTTAQSDAATSCPRSDAEDESVDEQNE